MTAVSEQAFDPRIRNTVALAAILGLAFACLGVQGELEPPAPRPESERAGTEIVVCGAYYDIGTPVVLFSDEGGYDAYSETPRFEPAPIGEDGKPVLKKRYGERKNLPADVAQRVGAAGWTRQDLSQVVRQFVIHYDVCGTSRQCFKILQDKRNLSVHFMLDVDGTIYQTLDLKERAWHAGTANDFSIGIEVAHIGAYPAPGHPVMRSWYGEDEDGEYVVFPKWMPETGIRTPSFVARPAQAGLITGEIHGKPYWMHDYTKEQHEALARLTGALSRILPSIRLDVPRDATTGAPRTDALTGDELAAYSGVLGHLHVTSNKTDPGPALSWEELLRRARHHAAGL
ncbi:MAG: N-acetylmuramoyl-L-alanine amidase [Planctomycetota bacterium]|nr:N-acetylmuramoyl-L-alanine amidase [Planctomycetota bacterium]